MHALARARLWNLTFVSSLQLELSKFLATYGSSLTGPADWIASQMALKPTLHRAYYRTRTNPWFREGYTKGQARKTCEIGSRWQR